MDDEQTPLGDTPPGSSNLIPFNKMDGELKHAIQSKGGKISAMNRRRKAYLLKSLGMIVNTPLKPDEPQTPLDDILDGKIKGLNLLDIQTINEKANLSLYDIMLLELIRQSTIGHNYKALTYTVDLIRDYEQFESMVEQTLITNDKIRNMIIQSVQVIPGNRQIIDEYEDIFRLFNPELFDGKGEQ